MWEVVTQKKILFHTYYVNSQPLGTGASSEG